MIEANDKWINEKEGNQFLSKLISSDHRFYFSYNFDLGHHIIEVLSGAPPLFGCTESELLEDGQFDTFIHPDDKEKVFESKQKQLISGSEINLEYRIIDKQGKTKWVKEIGSVGKNQIHACIEDITNMKLNVFMSNAFTSYQNAVNNGSVVSISDKDGRLLFVNEHFITESGFQRHELIGKDFSLLQSGYHPKSFFAQLWKTVLSGKIWRGQIRNKRKDATFYWLDTVISPILNEKGQVDQFLSISNVINEQKENEYALLESEALNHTIIQSLHTSYAILSEEGVVSRVNNNWARESKKFDQNHLCKIAASEDYFEHLKCLIAEGDMQANALLENIYKVLHGEVKNTEMEYSFFYEGKEKWFSFHLSKFDKEKRHIIVSYFDISFRKNQESILRNSEARLNEAQRIARIGSWEHDIYSDTLIGSPEVSHIFGMEPLREDTHVPFSLFLSKVHPDDREMLQSAYTKALKEGVPYNIVHRIILNDGSIKYINEQAEVFRDEQGNAIRSLGTAQDVTEQKYFEISLEKERQRYKNLVENISDGLMIDDINGKVTYVNKRFIEMMGLDETDIGEFEFTDFVSDEFVETIKDRHNRRMRGEDMPSVFEYEGKKKNGEKRWFEARVTKIIDQGKILGTQSAIRDITESRESLQLIKESESEKTRLLNELTKRFNELMQFNYIVSHNLRAPIANLIGLSDVFDMPNLPEDEKSNIIKHIRTSILKIDDLVQDLNIILATKSDINLKRESIEIGSVVKSIRHILSTQIEESNAEIVCDIAPEASKIFSIRSYIKSILYNLVSNAIKYAHPLRKPKIQIQVTQDKQNWELRVKDNGLGIDLERHGSEVFGLYKRFNLEIEGKGLGLNMTKAQVEALGGSIELESALGEGTTFKIKLPVES